MANAAATSTAMQGGTANATATAIGGNGGTGATTGVAGVANASSIAATVNSYLAQAQSTASGSSGQAQATAQTNFGGFSSVQTMATSPVGGGTTPANAVATAGGTISFSNAITPGQSFSVVFDPLTLAFGSMGAGYGGTGQSLTYEESASFIFTGKFFLLGLLNNNAVGNGFDSALFKISVNNTVVDSWSFGDLASAEAFFFLNPIDVPLPDGPDNVQLLFDETMSSAGGFSFNYGVAADTTPLPATLPLFATGLGAIGLLGWRRKRKARAVA
jgi:hypothetical protein